MKVFILARCRNPDLLQATTLVFDTLRIGFPTAEVLVFDNANSTFACSAIRDACRKAKTEFIGMPEEVTHHHWCEGIITACMKNEQAEPFYLCDTDVIFWEKVEGWSHGDAPLAGRYIPAFLCEFTKCYTYPRLHTSLLYVNPKILKAKLDAYVADLPRTSFNPMANLFYPIHIPGIGFFDTCSLLYRVAGGHGFTEGQLDCYDHLHAGTISDIVGPHIGDGGMQERHAAFLANPETMRGLWRKQEAWFAAHSG